MQKLLLTLVCSVFLIVPSVAFANEGMTDGSALAPQPQPADYATGYNHLKAGQYRDAIRVFKTVIRAEPTHAMAYTNMAYSFRQLGKYKRAIKLYRKALALQPDLAEAHEYMGEALLAVGKVEEAKSHLTILEQLDAKMATELRSEIARHDGS